MSVKKAPTCRRIYGIEQSGMTLIEVLVSVVVVSVGLLGVAALQVTTLQNTHNSLLRTQASALADDILDRMRANRTVALSGSYNRAIGDTAPTATATRADNDLKEWYAAIKALMPNAKNGASDGAIQVNPDGAATITIQWGERDTKDAAVPADPLQFSTNTEL